MALVLTAEQMRAVDRAAIDRLGIPSEVLMENAGRGVALAIERFRGPVRGLDLRIVCGAGQNGGDGFVVARHLVNAGARVTVLLAAPRAKVTGAAAVFVTALEKMQGVVAPGSLTFVDASAEAKSSGWGDRLAGAALVVDALFGTGLRADVTGVAAAAIEAMNAQAAPIVAIDLPSGLDADTGRTHGVAVSVALTVTMAARKPGLVLDADAAVGSIEVADIGIDPALLLDAAKGPLCHWVEADDVAPLLPRRSPGAHKGTGGHLLLIAGSPGKTGAAVLAGRTALRSGAGLVTIASTAAGQTALDAKVLELMTERYAEGDDADEASFSRIAALAARMKAVALGPGIPTGAGMAALVKRIVAELPVPVVVDADGLNLLGREAATLAARAPAPRLFTPHPGEMARLMGATIGEIQADRLGQARRLAAASGAVVILKGARTVTATRDGTAYVNPAATASLGTAGSGDVLLGLLGGLCAQGMAPVDAARAGVFVHGEAAAVAQGSVGSRLLVAGDLPEAIARVIERELRRRE